MVNREEQIGNQFLSLVKNKKDEVIDALLMANIDVDEEVSSSKLLNVINGVFRAYDEKNDTNSKNAILNISQLIANQSSMFSSFYNATEGGSRPDLPTTIVQNNSGDGNEEPTRDRSGNIINEKNINKALEVGNALLKWWGSRGKDTENNDTNDKPTLPEPIKGSSSGISTGKIIALSFVGLLLIGGIVVAVKMSK
jgi:hypothetical protein